jgi:heme-degrading monooxygenase HmoA
VILIGALQNVLLLADQLVGKSELEKGPIFVAIADIELKNGMEQKFTEWFSKSNQILARQTGFIARRFLKSAKGENHRILVIMQSKEDFAKMRATSDHARLHEEALTFMTRPPKISAYQSLSD